MLLVLHDALREGIKSYAGPCPPQGCFETPLLKLSVCRPAREPKTGKPPKVLPRVLSGVLSGVLLRVLSSVLFLLFATERTPGEHSREHS